MINKYYSFIKENSSFIQILPDNKDVFVSHATWEGYNSMLKVIKRYEMPLKRTSAPDS